MNVQAANLFFSLLAMATLVGTIAIGVLFLINKVAPTEQTEALIATLRPVAIPLAALVAVGATLGSLYYSEVAHFEPCKYCWLQRIAMYPTALMLLIASWRRDVSIKLYLIALTGLGAAVSTYHVYIERYPSAGGSCSPTVPCNVSYFSQWGFVTLAFMALTAFTAIIALLSIAAYDSTVSDSNEDIH